MQHGAPSRHKPRGKSAVTAMVAWHVHFTGSWASKAWIPRPAGGRSACVLNRSQRRASIVEYPATRGPGHARCTHVMEGIAKARAWPHPRVCRAIKVALPQRAEITAAPRQERTKPHSTWPAQLLDPQAQMRVWKKRCLSGNAMVAKGVSRSGARGGACFPPRS